MSRMNWKERKLSKLSDDEKRDLKRRVSLDIYIHQTTIDIPSIHIVRIQKAVKVIAIVPIL